MIDKVKDNIYMADFSKLFLVTVRGVWGIHHFLKIWVSQFVEICIERDRILTKKILKNASEPSIQAENAPPPIQNSMFFWGKGVPPDSPPNSRVKVSGKSVFFKPLATLLSRDLLAGFKGPLLRGGWGEEGKRKGREEKGREKI